MFNIHLKFDNEESFNLTMDEGADFELEMLPRIDGEAYSGSYEAVSHVEADYYLPTAHKILANNITIKKIPYESVSNPKGGLTVTIGGY